MTWLPPMTVGTASLAADHADVDLEVALATLDAAWEAGWCAFDTAPHYGAGSAERRLGHWITSREHRALRVSTKVGRLLKPGPDGHLRTRPAFSPAAIRSSLTGSLERLGVSSVTVAYLHNPEAVPIPEAVAAAETLRDLQGGGVVGRVGMATMAPAYGAQLLRAHRFDVVMLARGATLIDQSAEADLLPLCASSDVPVNNAAIFESGILARPIVDTSARFRYSLAPDDVLQRTRRIAQVCAEHGTDLPTAAMHFARSRPGVRGLTVGVAEPAHVRQACDRLASPPPPELWIELSRRGLVPAASEPGHHNR